MTFFFSCEAYGGAFDPISDLGNEFEKKLELLKDKNYGDELIHIGIIPVCVPEKIKEDWPERKLFKRKDREADIRLYIDYKAMKRGPEEKRYELFYDNVIASIETLRKKVSKSFKFDELIQDVKELLERK